MVTESEILEFGFEKLDVSTDTEGIYQYSISRQDLSNIPGFAPSHIYKLFWDYNQGFIIRGWYKRPNTEGVKERMTKTVMFETDTASKIEEKMSVIIRSDMNKYNSARTKV